MLFLTECLGSQTVASFQEVHRCTLSRVAAPDEDLLCLCREEMKSARWTIKAGFFGMFMTPRLHVSADASMLHVYLQVFMNFARGAAAVFCSGELNWVNLCVMLELLFSVRAGWCEV